MLNVTQLRTDLNDLTGGSLQTLNEVCKRNNLVPDLIINDEGDLCRYTFLGANTEGQIAYHHSVMAPRNKSLECRLILWLKVRSLQKETARIQKGLVRIRAGLDPEKPQSVPTLH